MPRKHGYKRKYRRNSFKAYKKRSARARSSRAMVKRGGRTSNRNLKRYKNPVASTIFIHLRYTRYESVARNSNPSFFDMRAPMAPKQGLAEACPGFDYLQQYYQRCRVVKSTCTFRYSKPQTILGLAPTIQGYWTDDENGTPPTFIYNQIDDQTRGGRFKHSRMGSNDAGPATASRTMIYNPARWNKIKDPDDNAGLTISNVAVRGATPIMQYSSALMRPCLAYTKWNTLDNSADTNNHHVTITMHFWVKMYERFDIKPPDAT